MKRENRTLQEMVKTMICENLLTKQFSTKAINTACYVLHKVFTEISLEKCLYELWRDK